MNSIAIDDLDQKILDYFNGYVVKKDLGRRLKGSYNVPSFVMEYLLANYCSTDEEEKIREGIENVKKILKKHYISPDKANTTQRDIRNAGYTHKIIDKIEADLDPEKDKYWASLFNSQIKNANINEKLVNKHDKMLNGGIWAIIDMQYDPEIIIMGKRYPFVVNEIEPIQLSSFDESKLKKHISEFSKQEWIDLLMRSMGLEPTAGDMDKRKHLLLLSRLIPLVEENFNLIELGPRGTGKSFVFRELSPYSQLVSGGATTVAQLFVNNATGKIGMVGMWDTVAFDEVAGIKFKSKDGIQILKDYMESGFFSRGGSGELSGTASIVYNGNINQSVESLLKTSNLFAPLPEKIGDDTAFLDRLHFYLPGWEIMKYSSRHFTNHFGFSVDFFSEFLKKRRKDSYVDTISNYFTLGHDLQQRDSKAVRKTVSGLIKLIHPFGNYTKDDVREYVEFAMEMRRRVKEQLKRMGGLEFHKTNFSYIDKDTRDEKYVTVPEETGDSLIEQTPLKPGIAYTVSEDKGELSLVRIETIISTNSSKISITGTNRTEVKQNIKNVYRYIKSVEDKILPANKSIKNFEVSIQLTPLIGKGIGTNIGSAVFVAILTAIYKKSSRTALGVLGDITIGGGINRISKFSDAVSLLSENGAKSVLVPVSNTSEMSNIPQSLLTKTDLLFYPETNKLLQKAVIEE